MKKLVKELLKLNLLVLMSIFVVSLPIFEVLGQSTQFYPSNFTIIDRTNGSYGYVGISGGLVTSSVPTSLTLQFYPNITTLTAGIYYVVFQVESEVLTIPFTKQ